MDVGGTFTDMVAVDDAGRVTLAKAASTPGDQSIGVMEGVGRLAEALGLDTATLLRLTERIVHGTTVATGGSACASASGPTAAWRSRWTAARSTGRSGS